MLKFQDNHTTVIETFEDFILTVYVIIDDLYRQFAPPEVMHRRHILDAKLSDPEIITIGICGELAGIDSENAWFCFVKKKLSPSFPKSLQQKPFQSYQKGSSPDNGTAPAKTGGRFFCSDQPIFCNR